MEKSNGYLRTEALAAEAYLKQYQYVETGKGDPACQHAPRDRPGCSRLLGWDIKCLVESPDHVGSFRLTPISRS